ncbi:SPOR domain-containing protein [Pseudorhodobacter sp.]|uniref:SPOR domain-containing protein n=1 Tax=Pseudorhodobacter sp. TaxID=1934400 RepID=UPI00264A439C|nr:SPOR domain-containing protein [Pseudorhodobacter sp.]MDN5788104.1 SPOR domain-containing protein [Pseudorhodobacter sp.]
MLFKVLAVASWAAVSVISGAQAQTLARPAEMPPASFKGSQYVDSRGCVFLRAGIGGRVNWVPRVSRSHKALCGLPPSGGAVRTVEAPVKAAPAPQAMPQPAPVPVQVARPNRNVGAPMETIASLPRNRPVAVASPAPRVVAAPQASASARLQNVCPSGSPYGARVTLTDGRTTLICSADANFDVSAAASRLQTRRVAVEPAPAPVSRAASIPAPRYQAPVANAGYSCPASAPVARRFQVRGGGTTVMCTAVDGGFGNATPPSTLGVQATASEEFAPPKGYRKAWKDDRLNPKRGQGTARGWAQQDQVWTREVPANRVSNAPQATKRKTYVTATSNAPRAATGGRFYVQVGTFGEVGNANRTASRLQGMGLPVAKSRITSKGRPMQIVMAGPFGDSGSAHSALSKARRAGFGDAFIR